MMKPSYVFLADGFEDVEAITVIDILRRANLPVKTVSIGDSPSVMSVHGIKVEADMVLNPAEMEDALWLILPGGMPGAENLYKCEPLRELLTRQASSPDGRIAAICASPAVVLGQMGLLKGEKATCYPGFEGLLRGATAVDCPVVVSGKFVLGNGPGNAMKWALAIVEQEVGKKEADTLAGQLLLFPRPDNDCSYAFG